MVKTLALAVVAATGCLPQPADVHGGVGATESLVFGAFVGQSSGNLLVQVINPGPGRTGTFGPSTLVGDGASSFTIVDDGCNGEVVGINSECDVVVKFTASTASMVTAELHIDAANDGPLVTRLVGGGVPPAEYRPRVDNFILRTGAAVLADFNADGKLDIISRQGSMLLNTSTASDMSFTQLAYQISVYEAVDLDGDSWPDAIGLDSNYLSVARNTTTTAGATPSFDNPVQSPMAFGGSVLITADFNGDARPDVAVGGVSGSALTVRLNTTTAPGSIAFSNPVEVATFDIESLAAADLNGDKKSDLAFATASNVADWRGIVALDDTTTTPSFPTQIELPTEKFQIVSQMCLGDVNRDSRIDAIYVSGEAVQIALQEGDFAKPTFRIGGEVLDFPGSLRVADLNGDGAPDLMITHDRRLDVYFNATPIGGEIAIYAGPLEFDLPPSATGAAVGDVNGDGKLDLVVSAESNGVVSIFLAK